MTTKSADLAAAFMSTTHDHRDRGYTRGASKPAQLATDIIFHCNDAPRY